MLPLLAGALIYIFFRPEVWFVRQLGVKGIILSAPGPLTRIMIYSGPDFFWAYAFSSALLFWGRNNPNKYFPLLILLMLFLSEIIQLVLKPGFRFDWIDLAAVTLAFGLSLLLNWTK